MSDRFFEKDPLSRELFKRLGILDEVMGTQVTEVKMKAYGAAYWISKKIKLNKHLPRKDKETTFVHEAYHIGAKRKHQAGKEVGARTMEIIWLLKRLSQRGKKEKLRRIQQQLYAEAAAILARHYEGIELEPWELLAVKGGLRKLGERAYEVFRNRDAEGLAYLFRYPSPKNIARIVKKIDPVVLRRLYHASHLPMKEKSLLAKKFSKAGKELLRSEKIGHGVLRRIVLLILAKQILEGREKFDFNELKDLVYTSEKIKPNQREALLRSLKAIYEKELMKLAKADKPWIPPALGLDDASF